MDEINDATQRFFVCHGYKIVEVTIDENMMQLNEK